MKSFEPVIKLSKAILQKMELVILVNMTALIVNEPKLFITSKHFCSDLLTHFYNLILKLHKNTE